MQTLTRPALGQGRAGTTEPGPRARICTLLEYTVPVRRVVVTGLYLFIGPTQPLGDSPEAGLAYGLLHEVPDL